MEQIYFRGRLSTKKGELRSDITRIDIVIHNITPELIIP